MMKAISMKELQEIAKTKWVRPRKRDHGNPPLDSPRFNATLTFQDRLCFMLGAHLLAVGGAEYADSNDSRTWTPIELCGH